MTDKYAIPVLKFCTECGGKLEHIVPEGEHIPRYVCPHCGKVHYQNPKNIVGTIPVSGDEVLLCRRAIEPGYGMWTLPAGHQEMKETTGQGAERETREEAGVEVVTGDPYIQMDLPFASQTHMYFLGPMKNRDFLPGEESLECKFFKEEDIPWDQIAFGTVRKALEIYFADRKKGRFEFHYFTKFRPGLDW